MQTLLTLLKKLFVVSLSVTVFSLLYTGHSEAAVQSRGGTNSFGAITYQVNPYTYEAGNVLTGWEIENGKGLVLRVQPMGTYNAFSEDLLFCGDPVEMLENKSNPMVLTFKTVAHRMVRGVGCHELMKVNEIKTENIP